MKRFIEASNPYYSIKNSSSQRTQRKKINIIEKNTIPYYCFISAVSAHSAVKFINRNGRREGEKDATEFDISTYS